LYEAKIGFDRMFECLSDCWNVSLNFGAEMVLVNDPAWMWNASFWQPHMVQEPRCHLSLPNTFLLSLA